MHEDLKATATVCDADFFEQVAGAGYVAPDPIFIVGLPRAGSTSWSRSWPPTAPSTEPLSYPT